MGTGSVVLAGLALTLLAPKAVHAIVATAVEVVNPTSNPVPNLDVERNARIPYESGILTTTCTTGVGGSCYAFFTQVPTGYRLVTQNISANLNMAPGAVPFGFLTDTYSFTVALPGFVGPTYAGSAPGGFTYPLTAYFDAGYAPELVISGNFASTSQFVSLTGYLESCAITGCHPIVQ
jgi:hypothetical protein